ncbi:hypothetical protein K2F43_11030 [Clostridium estertheticum]|uniref:hypothetical protein n=1 Tax=Clostridium estertheticum TaxID=238834 RepID=UPI001C6DF463|nr:hypothetical protein [Clostridium estertheticum]MBW9171741.1 hypothetical protein [Clostridium estertheticum]WLC75916.1 hypothetical protein KTC99_03545 [Clostridium estertheticum]
MEAKRRLITVLSITMVILSIANVITCMVLNFFDLKMGGPTTIRSVIVTFSYIAIWIFVLIVGIIIKNRGIVRYCSALWIITLFIATLTVYINATGNSATWALPLVVLFLGPLCGIGFFVSSVLYQSIIITIMSLVMLIITVISAKRKLNLNIRPH